MSITLESLIGKPLLDQEGRKIGTILRAFLVTSQGSTTLRFEASVTDKKAKRLLGQGVEGTLHV